MCPIFLQALILINFRAKKNNNNNTHIKILTIAIWQILFFQDFFLPCLSLLVPYNHKNSYDRSFDTMGLF